MFPFDDPFIQKYVGWINPKIYDGTNFLRKNGGLQNDNTKAYIDYLKTKLNENKIFVDDIVSDIGLTLLAAIDTTAKSTESRYVIQILDFYC